MATLLHRLGRFTFHSRRAVLSVWMVLLTCGVAGVVSLGSSLDNTFTIPGSQSQNALVTLGRIDPAEGGTSAQIVFLAPKGRQITDSSYAIPIQESLTEAAKAPQVTVVLPPEQTKLVSNDGRAAIAQVQYAVGAAQLKPSDLTALEKSAGPARRAGLTATVGGQAYSTTSVDMSAKDAVGVLVALVVLFITFGSLLAASMPVITAVTGLVLGMSALLLVSHLTQVSSTALTLAVMIGLAVGIDYTLFILAQYRGLLAKGASPAEAAPLAVATAGNAVIFAGTTVIIALVGLAVADIPFLTVMGLAGAGTVLAAVLAAITLLPALLGFAGDRVAPRHGKRHRRLESKPTLGTRWVHLITRLPILTIVVVVAGLLVMAWPVRQLQLALPDNEEAPVSSTQRQTFDIISSEFTHGLNGPLLILADTSKAKGSVTRDLAEVGADLAGLDGVAAVSPARQLDTDTALLTVVPAARPDDAATRDLVNAVRDGAPAVERRTGISLAVTGTTAIDVDVSNRLRDALVPFALIVVGLCLLILLIVFRSLIIPLTAALGFLLSVAASFGAVVAVFQWGHLADLLGVAHTGPVVSFLPIVVMAVLFGLAMDYEVFVVSGIQAEHTRTGNAHQAVLQGCPLAFRVVTAAALIMASVFAGFVAMPDAIVKPIAFALTIGVLVDALLIRMTLIPAVLVLAGRTSWWLPHWLQKLLPVVDIEGRRLRHTPVPVTSPAQP